VFLNLYLKKIVGEFKRAYPEAKLIGVEPLIEKKKAEGLVFDGGKVECITLTPKCGLKYE
jgi:hypothetical protein